MKIYEVREKTAELLTKLLSVWEASGRKTHLFLSDAEIEKIKKLLDEQGNLYLILYMKINQIY